LLFAQPDWIGSSRPCRPLVTAEGTPRVRQKPEVEQQQQRAPKAECLHLGGQLEVLECQTCIGKTRIKVFACETHERCTLGKQLDGLACCAKCRDYVPRPLLSGDRPQ